MHGQEEGRGNLGEQEKESFIDEEETLREIQNPDFLAMRAAKNAWPEPMTVEKQLSDLVDDGLLQKCEFADWKVPGEHRVPILNTGEIVLFVAFVRAGLCLPTLPFLQSFLNFFEISLNHLTPNGILHLSVFVHLCETFLGVPPSISLFRYFFHLKPHPSGNKTDVLGGCGIQFRQGKQGEYFKYDLVDSVRDWRIGWFYCANLSSSLAPHSESGPTVND